MLAALSAVAARPALTNALAIYDTSAAEPFDLETGVVADGAVIVALLDQSGQARHVSQATSADRPVVEEAVAIGRLMALFGDDQNLQLASPGGTDLHLFLVLRAGTGGIRVILARDTSQGGTTKPAYEVAIG